MSQRIANVLLAEDSRLDIELTQDLLDSRRIRFNLLIYRDGESIIRYLGEVAHGHKENAPDLLLIDMNLPKKNGIEVLTFVKSNPILKSVPCFILTGSDLTKDIKKAVEVGASGYFVKPLNVDKFINAVAEVGALRFEESESGRVLSVTEDAGS